MSIITNTPDRNYRGTYYHPESDSYYIGAAIDNWNDPYASSVCVEVGADAIPAGTHIAVGAGYAEVLPDFDFETYSDAGFIYDEVAQKWGNIEGSAKKGLEAVGGFVYSEHPSTEILSLAYNLKDGRGPRLWLPGMPAPLDLFNHILQGGLLEATNSGFEFAIWKNICHKRMGWPELPLEQLRDVAAKSRAHSLPGALGKAADVLQVRDQKIGEGKRLIQKFSVPRAPTKKDSRLRINPYDPDATEDAQLLYEYNLGDIKAESAVSACIPDLSPYELKMWLLDQKINFRGVAIDHEAVGACIDIVRQATQKYTAELIAITGGQVQTSGEISKLGKWVESQGVYMHGMTSEDVEKALAGTDIPTHVRRVLEIRASLGAASVKKLYALSRRLCSDNRIRDIFAYCGADRTGRWAGRGPQPQNLPNSGPAVVRCDPASGCGHYYVSQDKCPWCSTPSWAAADEEWSIGAVEDALEVIKYRKLEFVERVFGDAIAAVSGCLRGMFIPAAGKDFLCSDYSAIEAVVLAALAGEEWRLEVFRTHGKIYEMSAAKITGIPFEDFAKHKQETGQHHPMRKKVGKVAELASGYQGGLGAWKNFGADAFMTDDEIRANIKKWRAESPMIVKFWYGLEDAAISAVQNPGHCFSFRGLTFGVKDDVLYCQLLSGRKLSYHSPRLHPDVTPWGKEVMKLTYMGMDSVTKQWVRLDTYGGKLCENVVQATARDILAEALINADAAGYDPVMHIHDEMVTEVPEGFGSIEELERIMATLPEWCKDWPIKAAGGWRGKRYRKD